MAKEILKCASCNIYTLKESHCNQETINIKPAKFSPEDKFGKHRRIYKIKMGSMQNELEN
ncbi:MAG: RNA-protein complex protein Nop10 [Nanoarchaeota archaeon]